MKKKLTVFFPQPLQNGAVALVLALLLGTSLSTIAFAQSCEEGSSATSAMYQLEADATQFTTEFTDQETNFVTKKLLSTAADEVKARLEEFDHNVGEALMAWADRLVPVLQLVTRQLSAGQIDQTRMLGSMIDAQLFNEAIKSRNERRAEAQKRYEPSELSCQSDTVGPAQTKAYQMSRALTGAFARADSPRISNARGSVAATGTFAEIKTLWDEYVTNFCDDAKGDQGCKGTTPGVLLGKHKDIPALLWGDRQTIDMSNADNQLVVGAALRYLIRPLSEDPILPGAVGTPSGQQALLARRAEAARINAVYNVLGQILAERAGGGRTTGGGADGTSTRADMTAMREAGGGLPADASSDASYREIQQAMTKDRFYNPQYMVRMVGSPEQVTREQASINATRLQLLNDIYRRSEEMLFMEAAAYSRDLDKQAPSAAVSSAIMK